MTRSSQNTPHREPPPNFEALFTELLDAIRAIQPSRRPIRKALIWVLVVCATPIIANYAVPSAHHIFTTANCYAKYLRPPHEERLPSSAWHPYGATSVKTVSATAVYIKPAESGDIWFGAAAPITRYCDYRLSFSAELLGPQQAITGLGYGYAIGVRGTAINGVPIATTVQYDPPFGGLRTVPIPCCANKPGYNPQQMARILPDIYHRWTMKVTGSTAYVSLDGRGYGTITLGRGNDILVRVWNAAVIISNLLISRVSP
jgi:hypothetical protein